MSRYSTMTVDMSLIVKMLYLTNCCCGFSIRATVEEITKRILLVTLGIA